VRGHAEPPLEDVLGVAAVLRHPPPDHRGCLRECSGDAGSFSAASP
jgi:hypothetical protein